MDVSQAVTAESYYSLDLKHRNGPGGQVVKTADL